MFVYTSCSTPQRSHRSIIAVRRGLRRLQYRPGVLDGCLTGTGLQRESP
ncbi:hypothetical protein [Streptomyces viridosporus]